jgi:hypothetical protein
VQILCFQKIEVKQLLKLQLVVWLFVYAESYTQYSSAWIRKNFRELAAKIVHDD